MEIFQEIFYDSPISLGEATINFADGTSQTVIPNVTKYDGLVLEKSCPSYGNDGQWDAMVNGGDVLGLVVGHDHVNNTTFEYKGIQFSYGYSIDYFAYSGIDKVGSQRGCTMITCKPDSTFAIDKYNYYSDRYELDGFTREEVTMQYEDVTYQTPLE